MFSVFLREHEFRAYLWVYFCLARQVRSEKLKKRDRIRNRREKQSLSVIDPKVAGATEGVRALCNVKLAQTDLSKGADAVCGYSFERQALWIMPSQAVGLQQALWAANKEKKEFQLERAYDRIHEMFTVDSTFVSMLREFPKTTIFQFYRDGLPTTALADDEARTLKGILGGDYGPYLDFAGVFFLFRERRGLYWLGITDGPAASWRPLLTREASLVVWPDDDDEDPRHPRAERGRNEDQFSEKDVRSLAHVWECPLPELNQTFVRNNTVARTWAAKWKSAESELLGYRAKARILREYYAQDASVSPLQQYCVLVDGQRCETTMYVKPEWIGLQPPRSHTACQLVADRSLPSCTAAERSYGPNVAQRLRMAKVMLHNLPLYRLVDLWFSDTLHASFCTTEFFAYRFRSGLLEDELLDNLLEHGTDLPGSERELPVREALLPDLDHLLALDRRVCGGGIGAVVALGRELHGQLQFVIPLQRRSRAVADARGELAVLPKGFHQSCAGAPDEVDVRWTLWRELYEELFGGADAALSEPHASHDWYLEKCPAVRWFHEGHRGGFRLETSAFGFNAVTGNYDVALLLMVPDEAYWNTFQRQRGLPSDEIEGGLEWIPTMDRERIKEVLLRPNWTSEALFQFVEGLKLLKHFEPDRVNLPEIKRALVDITASSS